MNGYLFHPKSIWVVKIWKKYMNGYHFRYGSIWMGMFFNIAKYMNGMGSGDSSRTSSVPKIMTSYPPSPWACHIDHCSAICLFVCRCSLPVWKRSSLKKVTLSDLFLPRPWIRPWADLTENINSCKGQWVLHPYQVSSKSIKRFS